MKVKLNINTKEYMLELAGHETLLEVLREQLGFTGTKTACDEAECGACTVLINGESVLSCIILAADINGKNVTTIEGLAEGDNLHPIQQSFLEQGAVQCGFCMPGMVLAAKSLLNKEPDPNTDQIKKALDGNICRCAGYPKIFDAVKDAAKKLSRKINKGR